MSTRRAGFASTTFIFLKRHSTLLIEHLWVIVKRGLKGNHFKSKAEFWGKIQEVWKAVPPRTLNKLVESMPNRMEEIIKAEGGPTRY